MSDDRFCCLKHAEQLRIASARLQHMIEKFGDGSVRLALDVKPTGYQSTAQHAITDRVRTIVEAVDDLGLVLKHHAGINPSPSQPAAVHP